VIPLNKPLIFNNSAKDLSLENFYNSYFYGKKALTVFSARQALNHIYKNLFITKGKLKVYVTPLTCFEALYPIILNGHEIIFGDVNPDTFNLEENNIPNDIDVIQALHLGGNPQNMEVICQHAILHKQIIVEDCAQAFGSSYKEIPVGLWGDYAAFSFMKNLHAFGGGILLGNVPTKQDGFSIIKNTATQYRILKRFLESKSTYHSTFINLILTTLIRIKDQSNNYNIADLLPNNKIIDSVLNQLSHRSILLEKRSNNAKYLIENIDPGKYKHQINIPNAQTSYTRLYLYAKERTSKEIIEGLRKKGIGANHLSQNYLNYYQASVFDNNDFKLFANSVRIVNYKDIHDKIFCVPLSAALSHTELDYIISQVNKL
jgi:dTDP-4-amino-4,6-dideoxygalactose transaminase